MKNLFEKRKAISKAPTVDEQLVAETRNLGISIAARKERSQNETAQSQTIQASYLLPSNETASESETVSTVSSQPDVVDRGILSWESAEELFNTFNRDLYPHYPGVYLASFSAEDIRRTKPTLFLAIIAAGSAKTDPHLYSTLHSEVVASYVQRTIIDNEKSLELVQAQIITSIWYYPPGRCSRVLCPSVGLSKEDQDSS